MSDLFKNLYDKSIEEQMEHVNLMVFNGNTYHYQRSGKQSRSGNSGDDMSNYSINL